MGQPARKGQKENDATVTACFVWERVSENSRGSGSLFQTHGVILFFEGWLIQLLTQYNLQIAFYNKNAKYIYFWLLHIWSELL